MSISKTTKGMTLIELVLSMVVIGVSLTGALRVINMVSLESVDPVARLQAIYIARTVMEELLHTKQFNKLDMVGFSGRKYFCNDESIEIDYAYPRKFKCWYPAADHWNKLIKNYQVYLDVDADAGGSGSYEVKVYYPTQLGRDTFVLRSS